MIFSYGNDGLIELEDIGIFDFDLRKEVDQGPHGGIRIKSFRDHVRIKESVETWLNEGGIVFVFDSSLVALEIPDEKQALLFKLTWL